MTTHSNGDDIKYIANIDVNDSKELMHKEIPPLPPGVTVGCDIRDEWDFLKIESIIWNVKKRVVFVYLENVSCDSPSELENCGWINGEHPAS